MGDILALGGEFVLDGFVIPADMGPRLCGNCSGRGRR
jgi:hypothetical protein